MLTCYHFLGSFPYVTIHFLEFFLPKYFLSHRFRTVSSFHEKYFQINLSHHVPIKNMSSMYLDHKYDLHSDSFNKMLYGGANFVPIPVPHFCLRVFFPNVNTLFFNTTSAKSIMVSVETYFSFRVWSQFLNADNIHST